MRRNGVLVVALAGVAVAGSAGWIAGTRVQSSKEAAAAAQPPEASAVTVPVSLRELASTIVTRGTAQFGQTTKVNLPAGTQGLVTRAPEENTSLNEGDAFMEVNGQPLFALLGSRPMYRDLGRGDTGEDVRQVEQALARLGLNPGAIDGVYDASTAEAIRRLYANAGYPAPEMTDAERAEIRSATAAVDQATTALVNAKRQLVEGTKPPTEIEVLQTQAEVRQAETGVANAKTAKDDAIKRAEADVAAKQEALEGAKKKAESDKIAAERLVEERKTGVRLAQASLDAARVVASPEGSTEQQRVAVLQAEANLRNARQALQDAEAALAALPAEAAKTIAAAQRAAEDARAAIPRAKSEGDTAIRAAESSLELAKLHLANLLAPRTNESLASAVRDAESALAKAQKTLDEATADADTTLSLQSVIAFVTLPVRVDAVATKDGAPATGEAMTVSASSLVVTTSVSIAEAKFLSAGMEVRIEAPDIGVDIKGTIVSLAEKPGTDGFDAQHVAVKIAPIDPPENFRDAAVKVTIPVKATAGEVLVVPIAAVTTGADGSARVTVSGEGGMERFVTVAVGLSSSGLVEITPLDGELAEGDRVVVAAK